MKTIMGILVLGVAIGGVYLLNDLTRTKDGKSRLHVAGDPEVMVETAFPEQREIVRTVQAPGEVEACAEVDISSEVMGKILEMPVEEGDRIHAGDLLCRLDDATYRSRVVSGEAEVAKLKAITAGERARDMAEATAAVERLPPQERASFDAWGREIAERQRARR